ncbi:MAG: STAS domain-containing protein [bacterium]
MFQLDTRQVHGVPVIRVRGNLDFGVRQQLEEAVERSLTEVPDGWLLIDFAESPMVDSAGLGLLVKTHRLCAARGGQLRLSGINDRIAKLLGVTHLTGLFAIDESVAAGLRAFGALTQISNA